MSESKRKEELESDLARDALFKGEEITGKARLNNALGNIGDASAQAALGNLYGTVSSMTQMTNQMDSKVSQDEERLRLQRLMKEKPPMDENGVFHPGMEGTAETPFDIDMVPKPKK